MGGGGLDGGVGWGFVSDLGYVLSVIEFSCCWIRLGLIIIELSWRVGGVFDLDGFYGLLDC